MGRPKKSKTDEGRTAWVQIRCTPTLKKEMNDLMAIDGYKSLADMIEAWAVLSRRRKRRKPPAASR